jgi:hypothetical protein
MPTIVEELPSTIEEMPTIVEELIIEHENIG